MDALNEKKPTSRPALLPLDHPLCYTNLLLKKHATNDGSASKTDNVNGKGSSWIHPSTPEEKILHVYERQQIIDVL